MIRPALLLASRRPPRLAESLEQRGFPRLDPTVGIYYLPASIGGWRRGRVDCRSYFFRHSDSYLYSGAALS
jgi:hypothetical protein